MAEFIGGLFMLWVMVTFAAGVKKAFNAAEKAREQAEMRKINPAMALRLREMELESEREETQKKKELRANGVKAGVEAARWFLKK